MRAFVAAPGKQQVDLGKAAGAKREAGGVATNPRVGAEVAAVERDFAFIGGKCEAERAPDGVFETLAQEHDVWRTEAVVLIARKSGCAVNVAAAKSGLEIKRNDALETSERSGKEEAEADNPLQIARNSFAGFAVFAAELFATLHLIFFDQRTAGKFVDPVNGAFIGAVAIARNVKARG